MAELRAVVIAGDPLARAGLAALLSQAGCAVVGQVAGDEDLSAQMALYRPDVIVWDMGWDASANLDSNLEALADLSEAGWPVVALLPDGSHAAEVWAGRASGLLPRETDGRRLLVALETAVEGFLVLDPGLAGRVMPARERPDDLVETLTPREWEVLQLLADGLTNRAIAQRLGISDHTVKFHVNAVLGKLGAQSRTEAVVRATRLGLLLL